MKNLKDSIIERKINESSDCSWEEIMEGIEEYFYGIFYDDGLKGDAAVLWPEEYEGDTSKSPTNEYVLKEVFDKIKEILKENKIKFEYKIS